MSDLALAAAPVNQHPFRARAVALMLAIGIIGFVGTVVLGAYAPDFRSGRNGGSHALSDAATGYSALVELARATGRNPTIIRSAGAFVGEDLLVVTPERGSVDVSDVLDARSARPTLFVLPKWLTAGDPDRAGWVRIAGLLPLGEPKGVLAPAVNFTMRQSRTGGGWLTSGELPATIRMREPRVAQVITGLAKPDKDAEAKPPRLVPLLTDDRGGILLAHVGDGPLYVLSDPDLIDNYAMKDPRQAASALALLDWLNSNGAEGILFDVSLNGLGRSRSALKLLLEPPFLAVTLTIVIALALAGWQAFARFGPIAPRERAIALGKAALIDNSAALVRKAGRERGMGVRYVAVVRERAARAFGAPTRLRDEALDRYLDGLRGPERFTQVAARVADAADRTELLATARALHAWQMNRMGTPR